jgi:uncharacterized membrane protein YkvA (DUF1232 family)
MTNFRHLMPSGETDRAPNSRQPPAFQVEEPTAALSLKFAELSGRKLIGCRVGRVALAISRELASHLRVEAFSSHQMKKSKKTSPSDGDASYQKPALRSAAFARALSGAKLRVVGSGGLRSLFEKAAREAASLPRHRFKANWPYIQTMLRLVRAYERGEYKQISDNDLTLIVAALSYLIDPFDLIPDKIPFLGFVDDATVVEFVASKTQKALDEFMIWETNGVRKP